MNIQSRITNSSKKQPSSPHYDQDYEDEQQQGLEVVIQQKIPQEQVISLTKQSDHQFGNEYRSEKDDIEQKTKLIGKLKHVLQLKIEQIKEVKKNINNCKKEIKDIGEEVDKEMNKSIMKHTKPHMNISIQSIFQNPKSVDPHINQLSTELAKVRAEAKKIKTELKSVEIQVNAPINLINYERATEIRSKLKQADAELKKIKQQKDYLDSELKMIEDSQAGNQIANDQEIKISRDKNAELLNQIKEEKNLMYELEKEDRILTEKIRFVEQLEEQVQVKKVKPSLSSLVPKQEIELSIKQLIDEIRQILDKRNKIQNERKNLLKSKQAEVAAMETKNWDIINKLRQIDAKLIKHYNSKLKKAKPKKQFSGELTFFQEIEKPKQKPIDYSGTTIRTVYKQTKSEKNDKNIQIQNAEPQPPILVEKRKNYQFFMGASQGQELGNIVLSDEMLGNRLSIKRLNFFIDENMLYGISADYQNQQKNQVRGYKIMSRIKPKDVITKVLLVDNNRNEVINFIQIGVDQNQNIKYLHIVTSEAKQFKWGNLEVCKKNEQKSIRKYENIVIKGKLNQLNEKQAPNYYCLGGFGFSIVYLAPK